MTIRYHLQLCACVSAVYLSGCALTSRSEAIRVRYFTLEDAAAASSPHSQQQPPLTLRLGRVEASDYLSEDIAFRNGSHELDYYQDQRWTEKPQEYLRRALSRALYQERGVTRAFSGAALTLDVELVEFEEVRGPQPKVRLKAVASLHDERHSVFEETFVVERPIVGPQANQPDHTEATAGALADALRAAVSSVSERVIASLSTESSSLDSTARAQALDPTASPH